MPVPYIGLTKPFRHAVPDETLFCPECDRTFTAPSREVVERLFDEHLAEVRDPAAHTKEPF